MKLFCSNHEIKQLVEKLIQFLECFDFFFSVLAILVILYQSKSCARVKEVEPFERVPGYGRLCSYFSGYKKNRAGRESKSKIEAKILYRELLVTFYRVIIFCQTFRKDWSRLYLKIWPSTSIRTQISLEKELDIGVVDCKPAFTSAGD